MCDGVLHCVLFLLYVWCPCMAINVSAQNVSKIEGGGDTTISSPGMALKQPLPEIGLHDPLHGRLACPELNPFRHGVGQTSPGTAAVQ